jgi:hypothetical protein
MFSKVPAASMAAVSSESPKIWIVCCRPYILVAARHSLGRGQVFLQSSLCASWYQHLLAQLSIYGCLEVSSGGPP